MTYTPPYDLKGPETDVTALCDRYITVTPLTGVGELPGDSAATHLSAAFTN